jgi:hypothetical protein
MKRLFLTLLTVLLLTGFANAQHFALGIKAGGNLNKISGESFKNGYEFGVHAGAFLEYDFGKTIGIQPEVLFNQTNTTTQSQSSTQQDYFNSTKDAKLNYLSIPLLLRINVNKLLTINVGPQYSILMNKDSSLFVNGKNAIKSGDFAAVAGLQLNLGALRVYGRYNIGLSNINDISDQQKWKNQQIQLGIGFTIL